MSGILLIRDLAVVLLIAAIVGWFCQRFKLSTVVGYLLAGAVIGPHTPPFPLVFDTDRVQTLAQVGLVFLIFSIGLGLSINRIKRLGLSIVIATAIAALLVLNGSRLLGLALGYSATQSLVLAGMLMVSSSAIIIKILQETQLTHERPGQLALGMTVLEDVVAVIMLTVLTSVIHLGDTGSQSILPTLASLGAFIVLIALLSLLVVPNLLIWLNKPALSEIRTLVIAGLLLGLAWLGVRGGYSLALGAFILGAIIGSTRYKGDIERSFEGVRQMFGAVFFVAIGMLVDFRLLIDAWPLVLLVTAFALFLRPIACAFGFIAAGNTHRDAIRAGLILTPIGEFSFVIAQLGVQSGAVPPAFYSVAVGASLITSLAAPLLTTRAESITSRLVAREPRFLRKWIELYHDWLARLQSRQNASFLWRLVSKRLLQIALQVFAVSALILFAIPLHHTLETRLGENWLFPNGFTIVFWTAFGLLLLAPLVAVWRNLAALSMILAESLSDGARRQRLLQPLIETALRTLAFILIAVWLLTLLPFRWSVLGSFAGVLLVLAAVTLLLWRRLIRLHSRLEIELVHQFQRASQAASASAWSSDLLSGPSGWNLDIEEITLPGDFTH
ncbi:MAG TPA: cation:proton antiporter, partial [Methylomirabilota bacterium]|nr:cation:proton antiporter [Methylomirabilota bacterium]